MNAPNQSKARRSHARAKQRGLTRVGVHETVLRTVNDAISGVEKRTGKRLQPCELLDFLRWAGESLTQIGECIVSYRRVKVLMYVLPEDPAPLVQVVNGGTQSSPVGYAAPQIESLFATKLPKGKKNELAGSQTFPGME